MKLSKGIIRTIVILTLLVSTLTGLAEANTAPNTPSIPDGELIPRSGISYKYSTYAIDPDGHRVKYTFDWGDGNTSTTAYVSSGTTANMSHIWTLPPGTRKVLNVTAKATDEFGLSSAWCNPLPVIVVAAAENHPPTIPSTPTGPAMGVNGTSYSYSTVSTDLDGDRIKYIFDWGDGSTETAYYASGVVVTANHSWNNVPAGVTRIYGVRALSADYRDMMCPSPYWSDPLNVSITGPSATTSSTTSTSTTRITTTSTTSSTTSTTRTTTASTTPSTTSSTLLTTTSTTSSSSTTTLHRAGDANSDGHVDYEDLIILASSYGLTSTKTGFDPRADFDGDGEIGYDDLIILASNYET